MKELVGNVNRVSSPYTFFLIVSMMAWFCNNFTFLIGDKNLSIHGKGGMVRGAFIWYFVIVTLVMVLAAEAHTKVR